MLKAFMAQESFLKKIQALPEFQKKIIFWFIFVFLTVLIFLFWLGGVKKTLESLKIEEMQQGIVPPPELDNNMKEKSGLEELEQDWDKVRETMEALDKAEKGNLTPEETEALELLIEQSAPNNNDN